MTNGIEKALDRVRKLLALAQHSTSEAEAALAASRAAKLIEEFALTEALIRLDDTDAQPEPIVTDARLEPDVPASARRKRVAWKEAITKAVARDLGVRFYWWGTKQRTPNGGWRTTQDIRGLGRESAIQTWRYTCQYLWRVIDDLADEAWLAEGDLIATTGRKRAWKNAFRSGCAARIAVRLWENRQAEREQAAAVREHQAAAVDPTTKREVLALAVVEKDQEEVDSEYKKLSKDWEGSIGSVGQTSSRSGYEAGTEAGNRVALGAKRAGLAAGQGRLT